jgi:DNA-binding beta-propeller fold protein YncE
MTQIGSGYAHERNDTALVVGPTGLAFDARRDVLYVASTDDNAIYAIRNAGHTFTDRGKGDLVYRDDAHLHGPLALALAPNGDLITANGDAVNEDDTQPSELVEFTPRGRFVGQFSISPEPGGAFGIALSSVNGELRVAAVDDNTNTLNVWTFEVTPVAHGHHHDDGWGDDYRW